MAHATVHTEPQNPAETSEANAVWCFLAGLLVTFAAAALGGGGAQATAPSPADGPRVARGAKVGAVATASPEASAAALAVLEKGGNAFDALVASSFVVSVVRPHSTGIGGGGFVVYHSAQDKQEGAIDGREAAPGAAHKEMYLKHGQLDPDYKYGPKAAGVPGLVAMLLEVYERFGARKADGNHVMAWKDLVQPAIDLAEQGFKVPAPLAASIAAKQKQLRRWKASAKVFLPNGKPPKAGSILKQTDLARTLRLIARDKAEGFYGGPVAGALVNAVQEAKGGMTLQDLEDYQVKTPEVVSGSYRDHRIVSMPAPSSGGTALVQMLNVLSGYDLSKVGRHTPRHLHLLAETMRRAFADRFKFVADPAFEKKPEEVLLQQARQLTRSYAERQRESIDLAKASRSQDIEPLGRLVPESDHTTHISIVDAQGNAVASTQTINTGLGSCFVAGETGVVLNNEMADFTPARGKANVFGLIQGPQNLPEARKRPMSSMTPTIVFDPDGKVKAVLGSPGGPKIINAVLQVLSGLLDFKLSPLEAMDAPRVHHQWLPDELILESGLKERAAGLAKLGHRVHTLQASVGLGNAQIVVVVGKELVAVSDGRGTGRPAAK